MADTYYKRSFQKSISMDMQLDLQFHKELWGVSNLVLETYLHLNFFSLLIISSRSTLGGVDAWVQWGHLAVDGLSCSVFM